MTADHGQHQYIGEDHNHDGSRAKLLENEKAYEYNIFVDDIERLVESSFEDGGLAKTVWKGVESILGDENDREDALFESDFVFSGNGGLGQIYLRDRSWFLAPNQKTVQDVGEWLSHYAANKSPRPLNAETLYRDVKFSPRPNRELKSKEPFAIPEYSDGPFYDESVQSDDQGFITDGAFGYPAAIFARVDGYNSAYAWLDVEYEYLNDVAIPDASGMDFSNNDVIVKDVFYTIGQNINVGDQIAVLESSSGEVPLYSEVEGEVRDIFVQPGEFVDQSTILATVRRPCMKNRHNSEGTDCFSLGLNYSVDEIGKPLFKKPVQYRPLSEFLKARANRVQVLKSRGIIDADEEFSWPSFEQRMTEMNTIRSGDVIVITDGREGYLTLDNKGESYLGWHGGPTESESFVPLYISMPGGSFVDDSGAPLNGAPQAVKDAVITEIESQKSLLGDNDYVRNWTLTPLLKATLAELRKDSN